jgi:hypothetical protein
MSTMEDKMSAPRVPGPTAGGGAAGSTQARGTSQTPRVENDPRTRLYVDG